MPSHPELRSRGATGRKRAARDVYYAYLNTGLSADADSVLHAGSSNCYNQCFVGAHLSGKTHRDALQKGESRGTAR